MTEKLNKIKSLLNLVIKDGKKVNTDNVTDAISELELFPMTKALLQSTRIGKVLNEVRKLTSGTLPGRIKSIIRSWQILLNSSSESETVVIPCKSRNGISSSCQSPSTNCYPADSTGCSKTKFRRVNGSTVSLPTLDGLMQDGSNLVGSPSSQASSATSNLTERNNHIQKKHASQVAKKRMRFSNQNSVSDAHASFDADNRSPPNKCPRLQSGEPPSSSHSVGNGGTGSPAAFKADSGKSTYPNAVITTDGNCSSSTIPKLRIRLGGNGKNATTSVVTNSSSKRADSLANTTVLSPVLGNSAAKTFQHFSKDTDPCGDTLSALSGSTNRSSRQQPVSNPSALPRVKSTAELLIQYGNDIKGQKKTNILEIEREPDLVPSVLPESARPRRLRTTPVSSNRKLQSGSNVTVPGSSQDLSTIDSVASFDRGKSAILEKFLASTVKYSDNDESGKDNSVSDEPARYAVTNFVVNSAAASAPVTSPTMSVPLRQVSPATTSKPVLPSHKTESTVDAGVTIEDSETLNETVTEDTEVKRKHHRHRHKHKHKVKNKSKVNTNHPITNLMDRRPVALPPLPDVDPAKYPYPVPVPAEASDKNVERLLHTRWGGMNCCRHSDTGELVPHTEMYTLGLCNAAEQPQDSVLHMLPWVDLNGWRRQYFPEDSLKYLDEFQLAKPR